MRRIGYLLEDIADTDNLLSAFYKASRGKRMKEEVKCFSSSLDENIARLRGSILSGDVNVGNCKYFNTIPKVCISCF